MTPTGGAVRLGLATVVALGLAAGFWALRAEISGAIIAPGRLEPAGPRVFIQHDTGGRVGELLVEEGQHVDAGAPLLRLDTATIADDLSALHLEQAALLARRARLIAELEGRADLAHPPGFPGGAAAESLLAGEREHLQLRIAAFLDAQQILDLQRERLAEQIAGLARQRAATGRLRAVVAETLAAHETLAERGLARNDRLLDLRREALRLAAQQAEIDTTEAVARHRMAEIAAELAARRTARRESAAAELRDLEPRLNEVGLRLAALERARDRLVLRAPVTGRVHGLADFAPGSVLAPGASLLSILPDAAPKIVVARIAPEDVDAVQRERPVRLRFTGLPGRDAPEVAGRIASVSADTLTDDRTGARYYRAEIRPDAALSDLGVRPVAGMPVEAFIETASRTPADYLLRPLTGYLARAFRD
jgi:HlyD family type I secretion membrane fusion protein